MDKQLTILTHIVGYF